jgi:DNA-binding protein HU-beta
MTKKDLVNEVASRTGLSRNDAEKAIEETITVIKHSVIKGETLFIRGFGTLGRKVRKQKKAQNIHAGTTIIVPARRVVFLKPCPSFRKQVENGIISD